MKLEYSCKKSVTVLKTLMQVKKLAQEGHETYIPFGGQVNTSK